MDSSSGAGGRNPLMKKPKQNKKPSGGSAQLREQAFSQKGPPQKKCKDNVEEEEASRKTVVEKPKTNRQINALKRAHRKLGGEENVLKIQESWKKLNAKYGTKQWQIGEGIIINLLNQNLSQIEIRAILAIGGSKIDRIKKAVENGYQDFGVKKVRKPPHHALAENDKNSIKEHIQQNYIVEEAYPCAHRIGVKFYYLNNASGSSQEDVMDMRDSKLTWKGIWDAYCGKMKETESRIVSYHRWIQYVHYFFPTHRLKRMKDDMCEACKRKEDMKRLELSSKRLKSAHHEVEEESMLRKRRFLSAQGIPQEHSHHLLDQEQLLHDVSHVASITSQNLFDLHPGNGLEVKRVHKSLDYTTI